jgi:hypothetical protein
MLVMDFAGSGEVGCSAAHHAATEVDVATIYRCGEEVLIKTSGQQDSLSRWPVVQSHGGLHCRPPEYL